MTHDFTDLEMDQRLSRIRTRMAVDEVDAVITTDPAGVRYATGFRGEPRTLLLTGDHAVLYTSFRSLPWARRQTRDIELCDASDPFKNINDRLESGARVGMDPGIAHATMLERQQTLSACSLVLCNAIDHARRIKSPAEIALMRRSQEINEAVFSSFLERVRPGMTERAAQGLILAEIAKRSEVDGYAFAPIIAAGANAWEIHHLPDDTPLKSGDMVIVDLGVMHRGYASDMTRTICLGKPSPRMRDVHECVSAAQDHAFAAIRPGATTLDVDAAARDWIRHSGLDRGFTHGLGHGIGLEVHDPGPRLSPDSPAVSLEAGMAFTIEPGIYLEDEFGVRTEDTIIVRPDGYENLTRQARDLVCLTT